MPSKKNKTITAKLQKIRNKSRDTTVIEHVTEPVAELVADPVAELVAEPVENNEFKDNKMDNFFKDLPKLKIVDKL